MTQEEHYDVASYALGVLDQHDAARFEDHLIECPRCAFELESFVQVADLLADVDADAVVVFAMLSIGALFAGGKWFAPDQKATNNTAQRGSSQLDPLPNSQDGPGIGGPELTGQKYSGTDPRTGVHADVALEKKDFGTQISLAVSSIKGPLECRMVVVHTDGTTESLGSWTVGEKGWGTAANPSPLLLQAVTATPREDIAHITVQEVTANGAGDTLVRVP